MQNLLLFAQKNYRRRFSKEEDDKMLMLIDKYEDKNFINWNRVASKMQNRTSRQCRERYLNYLVEKSKKGGWTQEEDELIFTLYNRMGPKWSKMTSFFDKRSNIDLKNRFSTLMRHQTPQSNTDQAPEQTNYNYNLQQIVDPNVNSINYISPNQINLAFVPNENQTYILDNYNYNSNFGIIPSNPIVFQIV